MKDVLVQVSPRIEEEIADELDAIAAQHNLDFPGASASRTSLAAAAISAGMPFIREQMKKASGNAGKGTP